MGVAFLTAANAGESMSGLWSVVLGFITGFLGCVADVIEYVITDSWLALLLIAVPLSFLIFKWVKNMIKMKGSNKG